MQHTPEASPHGIAGSLSYFTAMELSLLHPWSRSCNEVLTTGLATTRRCCNGVLAGAAMEPSPALPTLQWSTSPTVSELQSSAHQWSGHYSSRCNGALSGAPSAAIEQAVSELSWSARRRSRHSSPTLKWSAHGRSWRCSGVLAGLPMLHQRRETKGAVAMVRIERQWRRLTLS
ncbi:hypothetical protein D1007_16407 [Hordeum vulgare]|nr:hypothetical protein D1007_16407 [Hordeum vulgare]